MKDSPDPEEQPLIEMRGVSKAFPNVRANEDVNFKAFPGEVHALLGENGAGKSTLMKILYGFYRPDSGSIFYRGQPVQISTPEVARALRIGMVFQSLTLIPALTVMENLALYLKDIPQVIDRDLVQKRIDALAGELELAVDPDALVAEISIGVQQRIEILKLLLAHAEVLILDEPTKVLAPHEVDGLFEAFQRLKAQGYAIIFITHKLQEVMRAADRITVMRAGRVAGMRLRKGAQGQDLLDWMFGTEPPDLVIKREKQPFEKAPRLELRGVTTESRGAAVGLQDIRLTIHSGEIVGVAGVSGNGQRELGDLLLGLLPAAHGEKWVNGQRATAWSVQRMRKAGLAFIPEDPSVMATVGNLSVEENVALGELDRFSRHGGLGIEWPRVRSETLQGFANLDLRPPALDQTAASLSGGNLQRLVLARELARDPDLILALYPTRGLDVPSAVSARNALIHARDLGAGVLLISEDLDELFALSDRLLVIYRGRIVGTFQPQEVDRMELGYLMTGAKASHDA